MLWQLLGSVLLLLAAPVRAQVPAYFLTIKSAIPDELLHTIRQMPDVISVDSRPLFSIVSCRDKPSLRLQAMLVQAHLPYCTEPNAPVDIGPPQEVNLALRRRQEGATIDADAIAALLPWNLDRIDKLRNGQYSPAGDGAGVDVYVFDTGVKIEHLEFEGRASRFVAWKNEEPCVETAHGTWVASIVAGRVYGVAKQARIIDVKLPQGASCAFYAADAIQALSQLLHSGTPPYVVVMSWSTANTLAINYLCAQLKASGAILVAAAGNERSSLNPCSHSPASSGACLVVASIGQTDARSPWSNYGACVTMFAPGEAIIGAGLSGITALVVGDGTSASAPAVGGAAAIYLALGYNATEAILQQAERNAISDAHNTPNLLLNVGAFSNGNAGAAACQFSVFF